MNKKNEQQKVVESRMHNENIFYNSQQFQEYRDYGYPEFFEQIYDDLEEFDHAIFENQNAELEEIIDLMHCHCINIENQDLFIDNDFYKYLMEFKNDVINFFTSLFKVINEKYSENEIGLNLKYLLKNILSHAESFFKYVLYSYDFV